MTEPVWTTACPDWEERIVGGRSLIPFDPLFPTEAQAALDIFRDLIIVDAPGRPTMGQACRQWVFDFVAAIFGAYDAESGRRLVRFFFELVAKKNSKSTMAAGIMLTALIRNWRDSGEFYILAPTKEIADNSFLPARDMVLADENLRVLLHPQENHRKITHRNTGAFLKVVAADSETVSGKKTIGLLVDELWLFGKRANAEGMIREAQGGLASRPEGFVIFLSTQSDTPPAGIFAQKLAEFRDIRDGKISDPRSLGVLYEHPTHMLQSGVYRSREYFYIPNPNLGISVDEEYLTDEMAKAERAGQSSLINFFAKHLNVQVGLALRPDRWVGADYWLGHADQKTSQFISHVDESLDSIDALMARCEVIVFGADGGGLDDLFGLAAIGREIETGRWLHWAHAWAHPIVLERRKEIADELMDFVGDGDLTLVAEVGDDVEQAADIIKRVDGANLLPEERAVAVDRIGIGSLITSLADRSIVTSDEMQRIVAVNQGFMLSGAIKDTERTLAGGKLLHGGRRLMAWCVGNAKVEPKGNAISINKQISGSAKIDPLMATFDAVVLMAMNPEARRSVYEQRGFLVM
jgi:phage terminase large subunit-like protein